MRPLFRGVYILKRVLPVIGVFSLIFSTSFLIGDVLANSATAETTGISSTGFVYSNDIPHPLVLNTSFAPKRITVIHVNSQSSGITYGITVRDALRDFGIFYDEDNLVHPPLDYVLTEDTFISIYEVSSERVTELTSIPFTSVTILDDTRELDTTAVVQTGRAGEKKLTYEHFYIDGILAGTTLVKEEILLKPQDEIIAVGTARVFREMSVGGDTFLYWKKMNVRATSYDSSCEGCSTRTATGAELRKGVCAVDPKVIPLYTRFYVPGYGFCQALDVGGAIKGNKIDLGFEDLRLVQGQWSTRYVDIYLLD